MINIKQSNISVDEYLSKFEKLSMHCNPKLDPYETLIHCIKGLRPMTKKQLKLFCPTSIEETCQKAKKI